MHFYKKTKEKSKKNKLPARNKIALELLNQRLGHRFTRSLLVRYTSRFLGATCHMTPEVSDFIPCSLEYTDKHIEVADGHHVMTGGKGNLQIKKGKYKLKTCDNNGDPFIATLHNILLAPDLCNRLFSIITK